MKIADEEVRAYLQSIFEMVVDETECWCVLNGEDIENLDEEVLAQCIADIASALGLTEEDVEIILKEYLK